ncbi:chitin synthase-domain-containing protein [Gorgonomyces haynaldii]|nr:chitin synthase-domain-containing protein [Gorgonomyces haynaldii]
MSSYRPLPHINDPEAPPVPEREYTPYEWSQYPSASLQIPGGYPGAQDLSEDIRYDSAQTVEGQQAYQGQFTTQHYHPPEDIPVFSPQIQVNYPAPQSISARHFGETLFRYKTQKTIELTPSGNYVVEVPVPNRLSSAAPFKSREFESLKYTAVVGDPDEFYSRGYTLRQAEFARHTEVFIVVTMYNEDETLFLKTWQSIKRNIEYMCKKKKSQTWGLDGWQKVVVCIVSDGRSKINKRTLATMGLLGMYQEGLIKTSVNAQPVSAHVFEYTVPVSIDGQFNIKRGDLNNFPVQVLFCLKEKNQKKINSHRWFFNAFGPILNPTVCVLIDVGTKPTDKSIYHLWKEFALHPNVAGCCGEIYAEKGPFGRKLFNPLVAAQNFEYKMSNILDKPMESEFGFISVLPGAFSAYRYAALQNRGDGVGPLEKYFVGETMHGGANLTKANMYLAEDRILCFELVTKRHESWLLKYVRKARAETDVPDSIPEYISQRRRWLNGSFFASLHAIINFWQIYRSGHATTRKLFLTLQLFYNLLNMLFNWFAISNFYLIFIFLANGIVDDPNSDPFFGAGSQIFLTLRNLYQFSVILIFVASLGNRPQGSKILYTFSFCLFGIIMACMLYMSGFTIYVAVKNVIDNSKVVGPDGKTTTSLPTLAALVVRPAFRDLVLSLMSTYGVYIISSCVYLDPWHMLTSFVQYLLLLPSFVNILMVYAFCNLHDVSWGTKGDNKPQEQAAPVVIKEDEHGVQTALVDLPVNQGDIDDNYTMFSKALRPNAQQQEQLMKENKLKRVDTLIAEDYFRSFRTRVVLSWILSNMILIAIFTTPELAMLIRVDIRNKAFNPFLTFILWSVAFFAVFRFVGSTVYIIKQRTR